ncbi:hypothetical protein BN2537_1833 [Streptomyces venezuelae]|nr:hypothetical protein BN2537_1833 [Streptomyces venezuelae]
MNRPLSIAGHDPVVLRPHQELTAGNADHAGGQPAAGRGHSRPGGIRTPPRLPLDGLQQFLPDPLSGMGGAPIGSEGDDPLMIGSRPVRTRHRHGSAYWR